MISGSSKIFISVFSEPSSRSAAQSVWYSVGDGSYLSQVNRSEREADRSAAPSIQFACHCSHTAVPTGPLHPAIDQLLVSASLSSDATVATDSRVSRVRAGTVQWISDVQRYRECTVCVVAATEVLDSDIGSVQFVWWRQQTRFWTAISAVYSLCGGGNREGSGQRYRQCTVCVVAATDKVLDTSVYCLFNQMTWLLAAGYFVENRNCLYTLQSGDDQGVVAGDKEDLQYMTRKLKETYEKWGLDMNLNKTKKLMNWGNTQQFEIR